jgi:hypothetical protein
MSLENWAINGWLERLESDRGDVIEGWIRENHAEKIA